MSKVLHYFKDRDEWLRKRDHLQGLGGSEIGAALGLNHFCSPYALWARKTGRIPPQKDNEAMRQGRDFEEVVANRFEEVSGYHVRHQNAIATNPAHPRILASIDRNIDGMRAGLECKTCSALAEGKFKDDALPESYYAQCVAYMAVMEYRLWYLAVLILGREFRVYELTMDAKEKPAWCHAQIVVDEGEIDAISRAATLFWDEYIVKDAPPPFDGKDSTTDAIRAMRPEASSPSCDRPDLQPDLDDLARLKDEARRIEEAAEAIRQRLMSEAGVGGELRAGPWKVTFREQSRNSFDAKAAKSELGPVFDKFYHTSSSPVLRISKAK